MPFGRLALTVGSFPSYLVAPAKARLAPVPQRWGTNLALASLGATAESSAEMGTSPAVSAIDGRTASDPRWRSLVEEDMLRIPELLQKLEQLEEEQPEPPQAQQLSLF